MHLAKAKSEASLINYLKPKIFHLTDFKTKRENYKSSWFAVIVWGKKFFPIGLHHCIVAKLSSTQIKLNKQTSFE